MCLWILYVLVIIITNLFVYIKKDITFDVHKHTIMLTIGFANTFYTLWDVDSEKQYATDAYGNHYVSGIKVNYWYKKNISTDLEKAKSLYPGAAVNDSLRGKARDYSEVKQVLPPYDLFPYGQLKGYRIADCDNDWQLNRLYGDKWANKKSRVIARRRLIELGKLVRFTWIDQESKPVGEYGEGFEHYDVVRRYATPGQKAYHDKKNEVASYTTGQFFTHGEKVKIELREVSRGGFNGKFGWTDIVSYVDRDNRMFKYMGSAAPEQFEGYKMIQATIEHSYYNSVHETKLKRIKIA